MPSFTVSSRLSSFVCNACLDRANPLATGLAMTGIGGLVAGTGPWLVGTLSDVFEPTVAGNTAGYELGDVAASFVGLQRALMATQLINLWAAAHFCVAARCLREEATAEHQEHGHE